MAGTSGGENPWPNAAGTDTALGACRPTRNPRHGLSGPRSGAFHHTQGSRLDHANRADKKHIPSLKGPPAALSASAGGSGPQVIGRRSFCL